MSNKIAPEEDEYGVSMHTALRKCCDSTMTSIAWNIIQITPASWKSYSRACAVAGAKTGMELFATFREWEASTQVKFEGPSWPPESFYAAQVFRMALEGFDEDDWQGMAAYLGESDG